MKFGIDVPVDGPYANPRLLSEIANEAEAAGWDGVFLQDVFVGPAVADPWITLAAVALRTERVRIGVFLTPMPRRQPWEVARQAVTIDHLSAGRLIMGAALGHSELDFTPFGLDWDPVIRAQKLDETLEIIVALWSGESRSFTGQHYHLTDVILGPRPIQRPRIPIWVAAGWPARRPLRRAATWDGVYLMTNNQRTGEATNAHDIAAATQYMGQLSDDHRPIEVAVNGLADGRDDPRVAEFAAAGATWWIEYDRDGSINTYRQRIRRGPPRD